jgi:hypothetical protein
MMRTLTLRLVLALAVVPLSAPPLRAQPSVTELSVAGRSSANPTVAAEGDFVAVVWSAATVSSMDLYMAVSKDAGATFSAPVQVNHTSGDARVSGENPARVALVPRRGSTPEVIVVWTTRAGSTWTLQYARSTNGGQSFSPATPVPGSVAAGGRGWHSISVDPNGRVSVLWLDHRGLTSADSAHKHQMSAGGASATPSTDPTARAGLSQVYVADLGAASATSIASSPCYCCKTAIMNDGRTRYAAWRHVFPNGERDIAFAVARNGSARFTSPVRLSDDHWKLDGCPDNGPALAVDAQHAVHAVWPTLQGGTSPTDLSLFYAISRNGKSFTARQRIPTAGPAAHVQVAVGRNGIPVVAWDEIVNGARRLALARVRTGADGRATFERLAVGDNAPGQWYPALASATAGVFATWVRPQSAGSTIGFARIP